jgi:hypothetical protein
MKMEDWESKLDELEDVGADTVGNQGDTRLEHLEQIADSADAHRPDDLVPFGELLGDDVEYRAKIEAEMRGEEWIDPNFANEEPPPQERRYKVRVDGEERELTESEVIARAQKSDAVDKRLQEAALARKEAERARQQAEELLAHAKTLEQPISQDEAIARELQALPSGELVQRLRQMQENIGQQVTAKVSGDLEIRDAAQWLNTEFADVTGDVMAYKLFLALDNDAVEEGRKTGNFEPYKVRYGRLASMVRDRLGTAQARSDKQARKAATLFSVPVAHSRAAFTEPEDETEESPRDVISRMAQARGQMVGR